VAGIAGNVTLPTASNVLSGSGTYGVAGTGLTPSYSPDFPTVGNVLSSDTVNGAAGTLTLSVASAVLTGSGVYGVAGTGSTPSYSPDFPTVGNVLSTDTVNSVTGTLTLPAITNVLTGSGTYGVAGTGSTPSFSPGGAPSAWDLRAGVTVGSVTGKLKVNCRNAVNNSYYNYDGAVGSIPNTGTTAGTAFDIWDTIDDYYGQPASTGFPAAWTVTSNYCGGVEAVADDDKAWKDITTTTAPAPSTCTADAARCTMKDKISGLEWSKIQTSGTWSEAINTCDALTHNGASDWRLPTQKELMDAYNHGAISAQSTNWITTAQMQANYFWSSSTRSNVTSDAWIVSLSYGSTSISAKTNTTQVACVR